MSILSYLQKKDIKKLNIVHVHLAFNELKVTFAHLSAILSLTWKEEDGSELITKVKDAFKEALPINKVSVITWFSEQLL